MTVPAFTVEDIGEIAEAGLAAARTGKVAAVFARSFYVLTDHGAWACVGPQSLGAGPLSLRYRGNLDTLADWLCQGASVRFGDGALEIESFGRFVYREARRWRPPPPPPLCPSRLRGGIDAVEAVARPPAEGLGCLGFEVPRPAGGDHVLRRGAAAAAVLDCAVAALLQSQRAQELDALEELIGLGPGLTPSGDDFLVGTMVALSLLGETSVRNLLWQGIRDCADAQTSAVSRAHLCAGAAGMAAEPLHELLCSILEGRADQIPDRIAAIDGLGHTSGWDALAGALRMFRIWLSTRP